MLLMTPNPPRSQAQISTQSRNPRTAPSPGCRTTVEVSTPGRGHPLARSPVVQTAGEVTSATPTGMTAATRPDPSRPQQVVAVTTPAMTGPETRTNQCTCEGSRFSSRCGRSSVWTRTPSAAPGTPPSVADVPRRPEVFFLFGTDDPSTKASPVHCMGCVHEDNWAPPCVLQR
ncbi:glycoprotein Xg isoform X15 [Ursus maritimus]|uniref:Glycoprotein Xg isoform X15 n=1 Tax=Ursus maritimus TaxID=29073 RepID=A0A384CDK5_URSMA|nr:glycoprotein Xg isoform X15 [Ursus maritimus]